MESNPTPNLNKAWCEMRADISNPAFDSTNPHFRSKFASLKSVIDATVPMAASYGIAVYTELVTLDGGIGAYVHLCHESGEERRFGPYINRPTKQDPQGEASASTYARRYALQAVFNVVGDDDDDGNAASESAFSSVQARSKIRNELIKAARDGDDKRVAKIRADLDNDQKAELMKVIAKPDQKLIAESLERLKPKEEAA